MSFNSRVHEHRQDEIERLGQELVQAYEQARERDLIHNERIKALELERDDAQFQLVRSRTVNGIFGSLLSWAVTHPSIKRIKGLIPWGVRVERFLGSRVYQENRAFRWLEWQNTLERLYDQALYVYGKDKASFPKDLRVILGITQMMDRDEGFTGRKVWYGFGDEIEEPATKVKSPKVEEANTPIQPEAPAEALKSDCEDPEVPDVT